MTQQEKENIQDDIESLKAFGDYEDDLQKQKQSPLEAFKDAFKGEKQRESQKLLDDFAKAAMQSIVHAESPKNLINKYHIAGIASVSYDIATAMMQERERRMKG